MLGVPVDFHDKCHPKFCGAFDTLHFEPHFEIATKETLVQ